jgi:hypothetical protein
VHTFEAVLFRFSQVKVTKELPNGNRPISYQWLLNFAEPTHEPRQELAWYSVGKEKVQVFLMKYGLNGFANTQLCHTDFVQTER